MKRKWIGGMAAAALLSLVAAGCRESSSEGGQAGASRLVNGQFDPPVVITTARALRDSDSLKFGDTVDDNPITRWARQKLGIIQQNKWIVADQNGAMATKIKLALSGGEELPDVLFVTNHDLPELLPQMVESGKIMDVADAFAAYASPRVKEAYEKNPDVWRTVALKGKLWGMPQISDAKVGDPILWIRQDWLDKLHLNVPVTLDELEVVMDAFTNGDPDGNGVKDTVGLAFAGKNNLNSWMGNASFLYGAYGDQPYQWNRMNDGTLAYGSVRPEIKTALGHLNEWYRRGYIDKDFGIHDEQQAASLFTSGAAGIISGPGWMGGWPLSDMKGTMPDAVVKPIPFPAGPGGKIGRLGTRLSYGSYIFRKGFEHMDAVMLYWDKVYGALIEDPESEFAYGFAEGYDYIMKDGEPVFDFPGAIYTISNFLMVGPGSAPPNVLKGESIERRVYQGQISTPYEKRLASTTSRTFLEGLIVSDIQAKYAQKDEYVGPNTPAMQSKWPLLKKMEKETFLKIVYGKEPLESFDTFVEQWRRLGGDDVTAEVNEWYRETGQGGR
ncbi:extracellular solute-binding protein [Paenibacillus hamazuiensis]|uniref:extracellular solute-binding protein n=1 Tax=Paenibacillus hamazuiensis TaxID=2936508 RepID=UPI00200C6461|nr:extracellular solute-binding protein [Paenibacillus hamazuiensis]